MRPSSSTSARFCHVPNVPDIFKSASKSVSALWIGLIAILTMAVGNLGALVQEDLKRMLAHEGMFEGDGRGLRARYMMGIQQVPRRIARFGNCI